MVFLHKQKNFSEPSELKKITRVDTINMDRTKQKSNRDYQTLFSHLKSKNIFIYFTLISINFTFC